MTSVNTKPFVTVSIQSLLGSDLTNASFLWLNRESSPSQESHHAAKIVELRKAHKSLKINTPFVENHFTESGSLRIIEKNLSIALSSSEFPLPQLGGYFAWLRDQIQDGLNNISEGQTLYIVFCTIDRIMRPLGFKQSDPSTWGYSDDDFDLFTRWLEHCFGRRCDDIKFVTLRNGTPNENHGYLTQSGKIHRGNPGGRPPTKKRESLKGRIHCKKELQGEAICLANLAQMNAKQILNLFKEKYQVTLTVRTIQIWLKEKNASKSPGRPQGSKKSESAIQKPKSKK